MPDEDGQGLTLAPFRGARFSPAEALDRVLSPPYDVIEPDDLRRLRDSDPHNVVRLVLPDGDDPAAEAAATLADWLRTGVLVTDRDPALYVYEQRDSSGALVQRGLVGAVVLVGPGGPVLPHEDVMPGPVLDRARLMAATRANLEPIWLLWNGTGGRASLLVEATAGTEPPLLATRTLDGMQHRLWAVTDTEVLAEVANDLARRQALIADGHHRYAAYGRVRAGAEAAGAGPGPWDRGLALLVDIDVHPPKLGAIHRHVRGLTLATVSQQLPDGWRLREAGVVGTDVARWSELRAHAAPTDLVLVAADGLAVVGVADPAAADRAVVAALESRGEHRPPPWRGLATVLLHEVLLPAWSVPDDALSYHHDAGHAVSVAQTDGGVAVLLAPLPVDEVFSLAAQGIRLPRKSTSFGPKPASGLVLRTFDADATERPLRPRG